MRTLALDPANVCGWAWSDGSARYFGTAALAANGNRLQALRSLILETHERYGIDRIVYEDAGFAAAKQRHVAAAHSELRGVIELVAADIGVPTVRVNPSTLKVYATGHGKATKEQMVAACRTQLGIVPDDDNQADALWLLEAADYVVKRKLREAKVKAAGKVRPKLFR